MPMLAFSGKALSKKARERMQASKWTRLFLLLGFLQVMVTIPILIATLVITADGRGRVYSTSAAMRDEVRYLSNKGVRVRIENIWFILYEVWRVWLVVDGIIHWNSLAVIAATVSCYFSGALGIMQIIETIKWRNSIETNLYLQIAMTIVVWLLVFPTTFVAYKLFKDFGWYVYRRIGPELRLQKMYYTVQCFTLALKICVFFEVFLMAFYSVISVKVTSLCAAAGVLAFVSLFATFVGRKAIADEKHWMMSLFCLYQCAIIFVTLVVLVELTDTSDLWITLTVYACVSVVIALLTLYISVRCQMNFNRGLKPYVQWRIFSWYKNAESSSDPAMEEQAVPSSSAPLATGGNRATSEGWVIDEEEESSPLSPDAWHSDTTDITPAEQRLRSSPYHTHPPVEDHTIPAALPTHNQLPTSPGGRNVYINNYIQIINPYNNAGSVPRS